MKNIVVVDVESDGPIPGAYSMVSFGAVLLSYQTKTFHGKTRPISQSFIQSALDVSGHIRQEHLNFEAPLFVMKDFDKWLKEHTEGRIIMFSDNPAFDWQWINYYFHTYIGSNPFGFSARRIGDLYAGVTRDLRNTGKWRQYRKTKHTHNPVDDAKGNAEALEYIIKHLLKR